MAKKFLYFVAFCIVAVLLAGIGFQMFKDDIAALALVPTTEFTPTAPMEVNAYQDPTLWYSRPGIGINDPARWQPALAEPTPDPTETAPSPENPAAEQTLGRPGQFETTGSRPVDPREGVEVDDFAVFFVHPTSYLSRDNWNAPIGENADEDAERIARIYVRGMASPFNAASEIWAPRYRQATMGAFLTDEPEGQQAIDAAYADVLEAYRYFLSSIDADTPIVLAGHSQGSLHLLRLLREEIKGAPVANRIVSARDRLADFSRPRSAGARICCLCHGRANRLCTVMVKLRRTRRSVVRDRLLCQFDWIRWRAAG